MKMISLEFSDKVAQLHLKRKVTNAINRQLVAELSEALVDLREDTDVNGLVLTSANDKFFSIGFDIPQLYDLPREEFDDFFQAFNQVCIELLTFPKPIVAALTGHAIAGGCILTLCCDYRIISDGRKLIGLNEVKLGVPIPCPVACLLPYIVGYQNAREMMYTGDFYQPEEACDMGLVDEVLPLELVRTRSIEKSATLGAGSHEAFALIKLALVEPIEARILAHLRDNEQRFVDRWYAGETRAKLREAMDKF